MIDDLRWARRAAWCSFSSSSISTSFISSLTPSSGEILRASSSMRTPKTRKRPAARKFVIDLGISVGTVWPRTADSTVMTHKAEKAAVKTSSRSWRMAIRHATKNVLSPISEKSIIVKARKSECIGEMTAGSCSEMGEEGSVMDEDLSGMMVVSFGEEGFSG